MKVIAATGDDAADWQILRAALWPDTPPDEQASEFADLLAHADKGQCLLARSDSGEAIGFAEVSLRHDYVNGCETTPVAFLEGIYVVPGARRHGIARALVDAAEGWARQQGVTEFASDALVGNHESHKMHNALGFSETGRVVYFRKVLA